MCARGLLVSLQQAASENNYEDRKVEAGLMQTASDHFHGRCCSIQPLPLPLPVTAVKSGSVCQEP